MCVCRWLLHNRCATHNKKQGSRLFVEIGKKGAQKQTIIIIIINGP
jgi:hypothetical protein